MDFLIELIDTYFILILLLVLIIFFAFIFRKSSKVYSRYDESMDLSRSMAKRQVESIEIQKEILNQANKTNKLLSDLVKLNKEQKE